MTKVGHWGNLGRRSAAAGIVIFLTFSWKCESEDLQESVMEGMHVRSSIPDKNTEKTAVTTILVVAAFFVAAACQRHGCIKGYANRIHTFFMGRVIRLWLISETDQMREIERKL